MCRSALAKACSKEMESSVPRSSFCHFTLISCVTAARLFRVHHRHDFWCLFFWCALQQGSVGPSPSPPFACDYQGSCFGSSCCSQPCYDSGFPRFCQTLSSLDYDDGFWTYGQNQNGPGCYSPQNSLVLEALVFP